MIGVTAPVWQIEVSPTGTRGRNVLLQITAQLAGGVIAAWVSRSDTDEVSLWLWRLLGAMQLLFIIGSLALTPSAPESPRYGLHAFIYRALLAYCFTGGSW